MRNESDSLIQDQDMSIKQYRNNHDIIKINLQENTVDEIKRLEIGITQKQYSDLKVLAKKEYRTVPSILRELIDKRLRGEIK